MIALVFNFLLWLFRPGRFEKFVWPLEGLQDPKTLANAVELKFCLGVPDAGRL